MAENKVKIETEAEKRAAAEAAEAKKRAEAEKAEAKKNAAKKPKVWKIKTPVEGFNGVANGVAFADGVGETDNAWFAQRCKESGYEVK